VLLDLVLAVDWVLAIYCWLALAAMVMVWLKGFNVVTAKTHGVAFVDRYLGLLVEPALRPIRAVVPAFPAASAGRPRSAPQLLPLQTHRTHQLRRERQVQGNPRARPARARRARRRRACRLGLEVA